VQVAPGGRSVDHSDQAEEVDGGEAAFASLQRAAQDEMLLAIFR
jgi:hypothetical protein